jgi:hypothetical protein
MTKVSNIMVEWLTLLLRIQEVLDSNLGLKTSYPERFFMALLSPSRLMPGQYFKISPQLLPITFFQIHHSPTAFSFDAIFTEKASVNKQ